ncbi:MAG: nucleotidyltransferase domain-containing protein [Ancrocorticia sp.]
MLSSVESRVEAIAALCARYGVRTLRLFGSATNDSFNPETSDFDFLVSFFEVPDLPTVYFGLKEDLEALLGRSVDLVFEDSIKNPYLAKSAFAEARDIYAA